MKTENHSPLHRRHFILHLTRNVIVGIILTLLSLGIGMLGYHHYENMEWVDAYVNAAMILSGMGPVTELHTEEGKIFAGSYAIFSGIGFLIIMGIVFIPVFQRFFKKMHIEYKELDKTQSSQDNPK